MEKYSKREGPESAPCRAGPHVIEPQNHKSKRRYPVDLLFILFAIGSWLPITSVFIEFPVFVNITPEAWSFPSHAALGAQCGNIGLIIYFLLRKWLPNIHDKYYIYSLLTLGCISMLFIIRVYNVTFDIGGKARSLPLIVMVFLSALVGCTSVVLFIPYMRYFKSMYLNSYMIGEALGAWIASILTMIQGVSHKSKCGTADTPLASLFLSLEGYFSILLAFQLLSLISFYLLNNLRYIRFDKRDQKEVMNARPDDERPLRLSDKLLVVVFAVQSGFLYGVLPSAQSYSCLPYGSAVYHVTASVSRLEAPLMYAASRWLPRATARALALAAAGWAVVAAYLVATAALSPNPPLQHHVSGKVIVISAWILSTALASYFRLGMYSTLRAAGGRSMRRGAACSQIGSSLGSLTAFALISYTSVFTQPNLCP